MNALGTSKFRNIGLLLIIFVALVLVILVREFDKNSIQPSIFDESSTPAHVDSIRLPSGGGSAAQQQSHPDSNGLRVVSSSADVYGKFSGTKAQMDELNQWRFERGYMPFGADKEQNAYSSYTEETLRSLAKNGDIVALHVLADRYLDLDYIKSHGIDILTVGRIRGDFLTDAAIRGSTRALMELGVDYGAEHGNVLGSYDAKKAVEIEVLAIYKVAAFRGDPDHFIDELRVSKSIRSIDITGIDKQHIDLRAKEIYAELQAKRKEIGLSDFDNSVPETVKNFYESKYGTNYQ